MSQPSSSKSVGELMPGGTLLVDPDMLKKRPERNDITVIEITAAKAADRLSEELAADFLVFRKSSLARSALARAKNRRRPAGNAAAMAE